VHRLDKETSGVVVVAKTLAASSRLSAQFRTRVVDKTYVAVLAADPGADRVVDAPLVRRSSGKVTVAISAGAAPSDADAPAAATTARERRRAARRADAGGARARSRAAGGARGARAAAAAKPAVTRFRGAASWDGVCVAEVELYTGRTHQIRAHARHVGCPVLGDAIYGCQDANRRAEVAGAETDVVDLG